MNYITEEQLRKAQDNSKYKVGDTVWFADSIFNFEVTEVIIRYVRAVVVNRAENKIDYYYSFDHLDGRKRYLPFNDDNSEDWSWECALFETKEEALEYLYEHVDIKQINESIAEFESRLVELKELKEHLNK